MLDIYLGANALKTIQEQGMKPELFTNMLGASGGPKWFTLFGLDKYIFGEFFKGRTTPINLIGSSAGAFRFAALSQQDPIKSISKFANIYAQTRYSSKPTREEISRSVDALLATLLEKNGISEIIDNKIYRTHFIVSGCKGLTSFENKLLQGLGLVTSLALNRINRGLLSKQYQRFVFHSPYSNLTISDNYNFNTQYITLNKHNLSAVLSASGAIPLVMEGIKNIVDAPKGTYRDGGIIDYHFDINIAPCDGLTLYPHFNKHPKPGWFDKNLTRSVDYKNYNNTLMLVPSEKFIKSLPYQKIPDRTDYATMTDTVRIKYWKEVLLRTDELAEEFDRFIHTPNLTKTIPL
ncbi:MAG: patatin-like phospholipase family protein [Psychromonas sp.]